jgi:hypothetical protein
MRTRVRFIAAVTAVVMASQTVAFAVGSKNAAYFGGTIAAFGSPKDPIQGRLAAWQIAAVWAV